jgi:hypothetical protein
VSQRKQTPLLLVPSLLGTGCSWPGVGVGLLVLERVSSERVPEAGELVAKGLAPKPGGQGLNSNALSLLAVSLGPNFSEPQFSCL